MLGSGWVLVISYMKTIIIDDTRQAIDRLAEKLGRYTDICIAATAENGNDGLEMVRQHRPELIFLDVELPDMTGISFIKRMKELAGKQCRIVIYTAFSDYMLPAFRNEAFDFLLKPIDDKELDTVINRIRKEAANGNKTCDDNACRENRTTEEGTTAENNAMKDGDGMMKSEDGKLLFYTNAADFRLVRIEDICAFVYDHELRLWTVIAAGCDKPLRLKRNVNKDVLLAIDDCFVQVSQKHIININCLIEVRNNICNFYPPFENIDYVKVGRLFRRKLIQRYTAF